jgi:predicted short-subunit dehydrogenase-like oxidoreductase (DUF2520 family)
MEIPVMTAIVAAAASFVVATLTHSTKLISDNLERRRHGIMHLMSIRNELIVNGSLAKTVLSNTRTFGIRFLDRAWTVCDASVIYRRRIPSNAILEIYSSIQVFNSLNERYDAISAKPDYGEYKEKQLQQEHVEMVNLAEKIENLITEVLKKI